MRLLDIFRRPDMARAKKAEKAQEEAGPLPNKIEPPPAPAAKVAQETLSKRASEEDAA